MIFRKSKFLFTIIFFLSFFQSSYSNELIIPKKKPSFNNKLIIPPFKPGTVIEKQSLKNVALNCPVAKSLHPDLKQEIEFNF